MSNFTLGQLGVDLTEPELNDPVILKSNEEVCTICFCVKPKTGDCCE